jgi:hypothetical protein
LLGLIAKEAKNVVTRRRHVPCPFADEQAAEGGRKATRQSEAQQIAPHPPERHKSESKRLISANDLTNLEAIVKYQT